MILKEAYLDASRWLDPISDYASSIPRYQPTGFLDGISPKRCERVLVCARVSLAAPVQERPNLTLPHLRAEVEAHTGVRLAHSHLSVLLQKGLPVATTPS